MRRPVLSLALVLAAALPALAQPPAAEEPGPPAARAEVLVLGTYHMANPGRDIYNMQADDVLAPKRQAEMRSSRGPEEFRPTKVAVERDAWDGRTAKDYADYLAGKRELTRNEIEQVGFRLARDLGHKAVYPADADGDFPYPRLVNYAKASGRSKELDAISARLRRHGEGARRVPGRAHVLETLLYMNADEKVAHESGLYYRMAHFGEPGDWAGADLVADWFRRNMRIFATCRGSPTPRTSACWSSSAPATWAGCITPSPATPPSACASSRSS